MMIGGERTRDERGGEWKGEGERRKRGRGSRQEASNVTSLLDLANGVCVRTLVTVTGCFSSHGAHSYNCYAKQRLAITESKMCGACVACRVSTCPVSCLCDCKCA